MKRELVPSVITATAALIKAAATVVIPTVSFDNKASPFQIYCSDCTLTTECEILTDSGYKLYPGVQVTPFTMIKDIQWCHPKHTCPEAHNWEIYFRGNTNGDVHKVRLCQAR